MLDRGFGDQFMPEADFIGPVHNALDFAYRSPCQAAETGDKPLYTPEPRLEHNLKRRATLFLRLKPIVRKRGKPYRGKLMMLDRKKKTVSVDAEDFPYIGQ
jgi:hypothetical protein